MESADGEVNHAPRPGGSRPWAAAGLLAAVVAVIALDGFDTSTVPSPSPPAEPAPCVLADDPSSGSAGRPGSGGTVVVGFDEAREVAVVDLDTCEVSVVALDPWPRRRFEASTLLLAGDEWVYLAEGGAVAVDRHFAEAHRIGPGVPVPAHDGRTAWLADRSGLRSHPSARALPGAPPDAVALGTRVAWTGGGGVQLADTATGERLALGNGRPVGVAADTVVVRRSGPGRYESLGVGEGEAGVVLATRDLRLGSFVVSPGGSALAATTSTAGVPARQRTVLVDPRTLAVDQLEAVPHSARTLVWRSAWIDDTRLALLMEPDHGQPSVVVHDRTTGVTGTVLVIERDARPSWLAAAPG